MAIVPFASFAWALRGYFTYLGPVPPVMRLLAGFNALSYGSYVARLVTRSTPPSLLSCILGALLFSVATSLFWWTITATFAARLGLAYAPDNSGRIVSSGPYALVRHPFYVSYMAFWIGTAVVAGGWQWLPVFVLVAWYTSIAIAEERQLLQGGTAAFYAAYRRRTGMFIPSVRRPRP